MLPTDEVAIYKHYSDLLAGSFGDVDSMAWLQPILNYVNEGIGDGALEGQAGQNQDNLFRLLPEYWPAGSSVELALSETLGLSDGFWPGIGIELVLPPLPEELVPCVSVPSGLFHDEASRSRSPSPASSTVSDSSENASPPHSPQFRRPSSVPSKISSRVDRSQSRPFRPALFDAKPLPPIGAGAAAAAMQVIEREVRIG